MHGIIFGGQKNQSLGRAAGAHRIATILRQEGWDIEVVDFVTSWSNEQLKEFCKSRITSDTKFIGYSYVFHTWEDRFSEFIDWIRKTYPDIKILVGGMSAEACPIDADFFITGYAEYAVIEILKYLFGNSPNKLKYTLFNKGKLVRALHDYPAYPISDFDITTLHEPRDFIDPRESLIIETARGCKFKCDYCTYPILGVKGDVSRDSKLYAEELQRNYDLWGTTNFQISDETFNDRTEKIEKFANATSQLSFKPNISGFIRADLLASRPQDWPLLEGMGFWSHWYGIDSFNHTSAKSIGKGMDPDKIKQGLIDAKKYFLSKGNYRGTASMIIGLPDESRETVESAWKWFKKNWKGQSVIYYALYIPKTEYSEEISTLSSSWHKKGYTEMSKDITFVPSFTGLSGPGTYFYEGMKTGVKWQHNYINFEQAHQWVDEFYSWQAEYFSAHAFNLSDMNVAFNNIDEWINIPLNKNLRQTSNTAINEFIKNYIQKKLNWKP